MANDTTLEDVVDDPGQWAIIHQSRLLEELAQLRRKAALADRIMGAVNSGYPVDWAAIVREWNAIFQPGGVRRGA